MDLIFPASNNIIFESTGQQRVILDHSDRSNYLLFNGQIGQQKP